MSVISTKKKEKTRDYKGLVGRSFVSALNSPVNDLKESYSINADLQNGLERLRNRCRQLANNNPHAKKILSLYKTNIVGSKGVVLNAQVKKYNGKQDTKTNELIEKEWKSWGKFSNPTTCGKMSWLKTQELVLESVAKEGECLIIFRRGPQFGKHQFKLDLIPIDQLDEDYYSIQPNGNIVFQGVEMDRYGRPVAYYVFESNINDPFSIRHGQNSLNRIRIPAEDCLHIFDMQNIGQIRGIPWLTTVILQLHHADAYQQAELQMARLACMKQAFYMMQGDPNSFIDEEAIDAMKSISREVESGAIDVIPPNVDIKTIDWDSPNPDSPNFLKSVLRSVAAGTDNSYNSIASDLESVNYSSARFGSLESHEVYRSKQAWLIDSFVNRVYEEWLKVQLYTQKIPLPLAKLEDYEVVKWTTRGWASIDPAKDSKANEKDIQLKLKTRTEICAAQGRDWVEVVTQLAVEKELMESLGLTDEEVLDAVNTPSGYIDNDEGKTNT